MKNFLRSFIILLIVPWGTVLVDYCAAGDDDCLDEYDQMCDFFEEEEAKNGPADPLEHINRAIFDFNDKFYVYVVDPVARGYSSVIPEDVRGCMANFINNLDEPIRMVNAILQGRIRDSGVIAERFLINSTLGVYGFADVAEEFELKPVEANLGQTLGVWGVGDGYYLVIPFLGPSTMRDFTGTVLDFIGPAPYGYVTNYEYVSERPSMFLVYAGDSVNTVSLHLGEYEELKNFTLDPYTAFKNAYLQHRDKKQPKKAEE
ncbi:MAG: VacJ family lipoprotein [Desulfobulbaceae bacterium]|nr:VacJ family lipoprotein [Desulfobulbaceae bacterium]